MVNSMAHFLFFRSHTILLIGALFYSSILSAESLREFHERKCSEGVEDNCQRAADMLKGEQHANRIDELGDRYESQIDRSKMEEENKPLLKDAYLEVMDDYFKAEAENGVKPLVADEVIYLCAEHYNDHWRNRKMWWPTEDNGQPDWSSIYFYIVEHYYGYCLRSVAM